MQRSYAVHKAMIDAGDDIIILISQSGADNHEDHRAAAPRFFVNLKDARRHPDSIAGMDRAEEINFHTGR